MFKGTVTFRADCPGVAFESIEITTNKPNTDTATVRSSMEEGVVLRVSVTKADSEEEAVKAARAVATNVMNVLSYRFDTPFRTFGVSEQALTEEKDGAAPMHHLGTSMCMFMKVEEFCLKLGPDHSPELKEELEKTARPGYLFYSQFLRCADAGRPARPLHVAVQHCPLSAPRLAGGRRCVRPQRRAGRRHQRAVPAAPFRDA